MRQFSEEDQQKICDLYEKEGKTKTFIRQMFHCRDEAITNVLNLHGIKTKPKALKYNRLLKENYFSVIDCEEKAYILGLMFTDGNITPDPQGKRSPMIRIELKLSDEPILQKIRTLLGISSKIFYSKREKKETAILSFRNKQIADDLMKYNIIPHKTYDVKHLPNNIPIEYEKDFLRGLIDGDGSIYHTRGLWHIDFCNYNYSVCEEFQNRINKCCQIDNHTKIGKYAQQTCYHIRINKQKDVKQVVTVLYKDSKISLARKYRLAETIFEDKNEEDIVYSDQ